MKAVFRHHEIPVKWVGGLRVSHQELLSASGNTTGKENRQLLNSSFMVGPDSAQDCTDNTLSAALQKSLNLILNIFVIANSQIN